MKTAKIATIAVVTALFMWLQSREPVSAIDAPLLNTAAGKFGHFCGVLAAVTVAVLILFWVGEGIAALVRRMRRQKS